MKKNTKLPAKGRSKRRASILLTSVIMMTVAGMGTVSWLSFVNHSVRTADRDRARLTAFYAAEAGVEEVVNYFNRPFDYLGAEPDNYTTQAYQPPNYALFHPEVVPDRYSLFEPYIVVYARGEWGQPLYDSNGDLMVTRWSFFQNLAAGNNPAVSKTSKIPTTLLDIEGNERLIFRDEAGNELSRVEEIQLLHPEDMELIDGSLPNDFRVVTKAIVTAVSRDGVRVRLESLITENATVSISSPGAIVSRASATFSGNFNVHWGELWTHEDVALPSNWDVKFPRLRQGYSWSSSQNYDPWFRLRTEGVMKDHQGNQFADGRNSSGFASTEIPSTAANFFVPFLNETLWRNAGGNPDSKMLYRENLLQNQSLAFPEYSYEDWKQHVVSYGFSYFFTDTNGVMYGVETNPDSSSFGEIVGKSYDDWLGVAPDSPDYDDIMRNVVFIDSVPVDDNGNVGPRDSRGVPIVNDTYYPRNPNDPNARVATISISGGSLHTRGAIFVAANMEMTGQGNPPSWSSVPGVVMPNFQPPPSNTNFRIFHNGLLYSWGRINGGGNRVVYGSVFAEDGFGSNGDPEVYFNVRMKDGSWLNLNASRVNRRLWNFSD